MDLPLNNTLVEESVQAWRRELFVQAAATAWFCYDYILTLPDELRCIWWRPFSSVKVIFLVMRYAALVNLLRSVQSFGHWYLFPDGGGLECRIIWWLNVATEAIFYMSFTVLLALRLHVISGRRLKASLSVLVLGTVFVCCDGFLNIVGTVSPRPFSSGCYQSFVLGGQFGEIFGNTQVFNPVYAVIGISGTCCLFIGEVIVQTYTWRSTWQVVRVTRNTGIQKSLLFFLLRDGTVTCLILTIWVILSESISSVDLRTMTITCISTVVCRVIMQLRQVQLSGTTDNMAGAKSWISAHFMGNVGAPLYLSAHEERHPEDDDDDPVTYVHSNPLVAGLEVARLEDDTDV